MKKKLLGVFMTAAVAATMLGTTGCGTDTEETGEVSQSVAEEATSEVEKNVADSGQMVITSLEELQTGTYELDAELTCYLPAMGGCDFGQGLLESAYLTVAEDGGTSITLDFYELVTVTMMYGDATSYAAEGETAYYDGSAWVAAEYTTKMNVSSELSTMGETDDGSNEEVEYTYIDTMTFPITSMEDTYTLAVNVGGTQFGGETAYTLSSTGEALNAELHVYWDGQNDSDSAQ